MGTPDLTLEALRTGLAAALPSRLLSRDFVPLARRPQEELLQGVLTLINRGEKGYANFMGREAQLGKLDVLLIGQLMLPGNPTGLDVEQAELAMAEEVKNFLKAPLPAGVRECLSSGFAQSGQLEVPNGWIVFDMEVMGDE